MGFAPFPPPPTPDKALCQPPPPPRARGSIFHSRFKKAPKATKFENHRGVVSELN